MAFPRCPSAARNCSTLINDNARDYVTRYDSAVASVITRSIDTEVRQITAGKMSPEERKDAVLRVIVIAAHGCVFARRRRGDRNHPSRCRPFARFYGERDKGRECCRKRQLARDGR